MASDLAERPSQDIEQVAQAALAGIDEQDLVLPLLNVTQQLSRVVTEGEAEAGEFVNSLTGESHGEAVGLIVAHFFKGRFYSPRDQDGTYVASGDVAPTNWPEEYAGRNFADIEDAEEQWREASNRGDIEWGSGPPIRTTYNFVGLVEGGDLEVPVRLSLQRTSVPAARKIITLLRFARAPWDNVVDLTTKLRHDKQNRPFYVVEARRGRSTDESERQAAVNVASQVQLAESLVLAGEESAEEKPAKPEADKDAISIT